MTTTLSDIIVPELFNPYVIQRSMELSALYQSGIVANNDEFDRLASEPAPIHHMPFFEDLTGDAEINRNRRAETHTGKNHIQSGYIHDNPSCQSMGGNGFIGTACR